MKQVFFICRSCEHTNSMELGLEGFIPRQVEYESLTEISQHMIKYDHHVEAFVKEDKDATNG